MKTKENVVVSAVVLDTSGVSVREVSGPESSKGDDALRERV